MEQIAHEQYPRSVVVGEIMEQTTEYEYPPKIKVPRNLKIVIESFSRAVVERQPESIPHFATLYFAELVHFRAGT